MMNQEGLSYLKQQFQFERWFGRNTLGESLFLWQFPLSGAELPRWQAERVQILQPPLQKLSPLTGAFAADIPSSNWSRATQSMWRSPSGDGLINIDVYECETRETAHELLLRLLGEFQSPLALLEETSDVGDVAFRNPGDTVILFARANLVALLRNAAPTFVPVTQVAIELDEQLVSKPVESSDLAMATLRHLPATQRTKIGRSVILPVETRAELAEVQPVWYKCFAQAGDIRVEEGKLVYDPPSSGTHELIVFALGPGRVAVKQTVEVEAT
jgi:hypothetical protein